MSPLLETIIAVVLAVAVLMVIIFFMRADKESENESFKPEVPPQGEEKEEIPSNHPLRRVNIVFAQPIPTKIHQGKTFEYTILPKCYLAKDGKEYQVLKSSTGAVFYVAENGTRRYLSKKDIETLKDI